MPGGWDRARARPRGQATNEKSFNREMNDIGWQSIENRYGERGRLKFKLQTSILYREQSENTVQNRDFDAGRAVRLSGLILLKGPDPKARYCPPFSKVC